VQFKHPLAIRQAPPDFSRDVHCVYGLPFDAVSEEEAVQQIREAARTGTRLFLSTPNLNFAVACATDTSFRDTVINCNLSTADGASIISLAQLLGIPVRERVTGSGIFERLAASAGHQVPVYFFGGAGDTAEQAAQRLNASGMPGARAVGSHAPGFKGVEDMSGPDVAEPINASGAEFVIVALGARKGQQWIARNWPALRAPVISHLGAVVNFVAGTVLRAPRWVQKLGMEWLWRIKEEPSLWRRYWDDGRRLLAYAVTSALPLALYFRSLPRTTEALRCEREQMGAAICLRLHGAAVNGPALLPLRQALAQACAQADRVVLDLGGVTHIGSAFIALVQLLDGWQHAQPARTRGPVLRSVPPALLRVMRWSGVGYLAAVEAMPMAQQPRLRPD
jgi:N-acetylglucosaminyldiphosphoundecaprenol N-acetyl-beta-D-mannosaminyltransferase